MTFASTETSRASGRPITLFYFRYGSDENSYVAYTDAETEVMAEGSVAGVDVTYTPIPIGRDSVTASGTLDKATIEIRMPRDIALTDQFLVYPPSVVVSLVIRQAHVDVLELDSPPILEAPAIWVGRVVGMSFEGSEAKFICEPIATSMRRNGLRRVFQNGCPLALYGDECRADKPAATVDIEILDVETTKIIMPDGWFGSADVTKYLGGPVQWTTDEGNTEIRTILSITDGKDLSVNGFVRGLAYPGTVSVSFGCNRSQDDCLNLHIESGSSPPNSNIHNYGGQDWIPFENPVSFKNQFF